MRIVVSGPGSITVSAGGEACLLVNASPGIGQAARREVCAVVLTDAQIDHVAGLLSLHDGPRIELFATPGVYEELTTSLPLVNVLQSYCGVRWHMLPVAGDQRSAEFQVEGLQGLRFTAVAVPGPAPRHSVRRHEQVIGDTIALIVDDLHQGSRLFYGPSLEPLGEDELAWLRSADCLMLDGRLGGIAEAPPDTLQSAAARRKVLVHVEDGSPLPTSGMLQRRSFEAHGFELAVDGMEIAL